MTKQTAVEWLENQIKNSKYFYKLMEDINSRSTVAQSNIFEQAKEMEKKQIMNSWVRGVTSENNVTAEQYYNKTFKKD